MSKLTVCLKSGVKIIAECEDPDDVEDAFDTWYSKKELVHFDNCVIVCSEIVAIEFDLK